MERKKLKPWHGVVSFVVMMVLFVIIGYPIQYKLGLIGVGITELLLLVMAIGAALIFKQDLREVFRIKKPKVRELLGVLVFFIGGYVLVIMITAIMTMLFPQGMTQVSAGLNDVMTSKGMWLGILIVSVMPAICEEAVHRGFILHTFKGVKKQWVIVLSMALIFGVFHMDVYRFVPTAILGACMTWVMLKTDNMLMPSLYHGVNNLFPVLLGFAMKGLTESLTTADSTSVTAATEMLTSSGAALLGAIGTYLMSLMIVPPLMFAGTLLMKPKGEKANGKHVAAVFVVSGVLFFVGFALLMGSSIYIGFTQGLGM